MSFSGHEKLICKLPAFRYESYLQMLLDGLPLLVSSSPGFLHPLAYTKTYFCIKFHIDFNISIVNFVKFLIEIPHFLTVYVPSLLRLFLDKWILLWIRKTQNFLLLSKMYGLYWSFGKVEKIFPAFCW